MRNIVESDDCCGITAEWNFKLVSLLRQMTLLKDSAEEIFSKLQRDAQQVLDRSERLNCRLKNLQTAADNMPDPRTLKLATRPKALQKLYAAAGQKVEDAPVTENISTQTEDDPHFKENYCSPGPSRSLANAPKLENEKESIVVFDKQSSLPTPQEQSSSIATIYKSTVVAVDTSGKNIQKISAAREGKNLERCVSQSGNSIRTGRRPRCSRRNTVAISSYAALRGEQPFPETTVTCATDNIRTSRDHS